MLVKLTTGNVEVLQLLIDQNAGVNAKDWKGYTPLHVAVTEERNVEAVKFLIQENADVNDGNFFLSKETPLQLSEKMGHSDIVNIFKEFGP